MYLVFSYLYLFTFIYFFSIYNLSILKMFYFFMYFFLHLCIYLLIHECINLFMYEFIYLLIVFSFISALHRRELDSRSAHFADYAHYTY